MTQGDSGFDPTRTAQAEPSAYRMGFPAGGVDEPGPNGTPPRPPASGGGFPGWLLAVLSALVASVVVVIVVWFALIKPNVKDEVTNQVGTRLGTSAASNTNNPTAQPPVQTTPLPVTTPAAQTGTGNPLGEPVDNRLTASVAQGQSTSSSNPPASTVIKVASGQVLSITDVIFSNPNGDSGTVELRRDGATLVSFSLSNFRDQDFHFVAPVTVRPGQTLQLVVSCTQVGSGSPGGTAPSTCAESVFYSGYMKSTGAASPAP